MGGEAGVPETSHEFRASQASPERRAGGTNREAPAMSQIFGKFHVLALLTLALTAALAAAPALEARPLEDIISAKKVRAGTVPYFPATIRDPGTGEWSGYYVDTLRRLFEKIGIEVEFVETKWGAFPGALASDQFDVFAGGSFATPQRALAVDFTRPFMYMGLSMSAAKKDAGRFKSMADIDQPGVRVAVQMGGAGHEFVKQNFKKAEIIVLDTGDLSASSMEVLAGRADVGAASSALMAKIVAEHSDALVNLFADNPYGVLPISLAVAKGNNSLLTFLNTALDYADVNGVWMETAEKYRDHLGGFYMIGHTYQAVGGPGAATVLK